MKDTGLLFQLTSRQLPDITVSLSLDQQAYQPPDVSEAILEYQAPTELAHKRKLLSQLSNS